MHAMKTLKLGLVVATLLAIFVVASSSTQAYFYQPKSYPSYFDNPYRYGYQDDVSRLTQANLYFVSNFTYYPSPARQYFYPSYNYYGWGY